jgi:hypothetical protein
MSQPMANADDEDVSASGWTVGALYALLREVDKRYALQFKAQSGELLAADKRYEERFLASQLAVQAAFAAQKEAVAAALMAQKEATGKAEVAATKAFDAFTATITEKLDALISSRDTTKGVGTGYREVFAYVLTIGSLVFWAYLAHK